MRFLLDEIFPPGAAALLRDGSGLDAVHVGEAGLQGADDHTVADEARRHDRVVVTENVADYAAETGLVVVCVLKRNLPTGAAQARALAELLGRWASENPRPYIGQHWPGDGQPSAEPVTLGSRN